MLHLLEFTVEPTFCKMGVGFRMNPRPKAFAGHEASAGAWEHLLVRWREVPVLQSPWPVRRTADVMSRLPSRTLLPSFLLGFPYYSQLVGKRAPLFLKGYWEAK